MWGVEIEGLATPEVHSPHSAGFVTMGEGPLDQFPPLLQQSFSMATLNPAPIAIDSLLLSLFPSPLAPTSLRLWNIASDRNLLQHHDCRPAVVALVGHYLLNPVDVHFRLLPGFSFHQPRNCFTRVR